MPAVIEMVQAHDKELEEIRRRKMLKLMEGKKMGKHKVIVYSTPTCPFCNMLKSYLKEKGIEFEDIDVSVDHEKAREMVQKSGQMGVPVVDIDGEIVVGFNKPQIDKLLGLE